MRRGNNSMKLYKFYKNSYGKYDDFLENIPHN